VIIQSNAGLDGPFALDVQCTGQGVGRLVEKRWHLAPILMLDLSSVRADRPVEGLHWLSGGAIDLPHPRKCPKMQQIVGALSSHIREDNDWQHRRLFNPSPSELAAEASGQIVIYAGMQDVDVSRALDAQFGRVESMMFIRTQITDDKGAVVDEEDEGC